MSRWTGKFSYWTGTHITETASAFLLGRDDLMEKRTPHTVLAILQDGKWAPHSFPWTSIGVCWAQRPVTELVVVGHEGDIAAGPIDNLKVETPIDVTREDDKGGYLRCARTIGGRVYVAGMDRQVYRRVEGCAWEDVGEGLPYEEERVVGFEAIDGYTEDEIYAVGHDGEMWRFDGRRWHAIDSPTNLILLGVHCADDGLVYVCGQAGTILRGRGDEWEVIDNEGTREDFWDVAKFGDSVYLATRDVLYELKDGQVEPVDFDEDIPFNFYRFSVSEKSLLTIGTKDVMRFDGANWLRID